MFKQHPKSAMKSKSAKASLSDSEGHEQDDGSSVRSSNYDEDDYDKTDHVAESTSGDSRDGKKESSGDLETELVKKETKRVKLSKLMVYMVILLAAAVVGAFTYYFMTKEEEKWYLDEFEEFAEEIVETGAINYHKTDMAVASLCDALTSHAQDIHHNIPFLTMPNWAVRAIKVQELANTELVAFVPFVPKADLPDWEVFAVQHQSWLQQDLNDTEHHDVNPGPIPSKVYPYHHNGQANEDEEENQLFTFPIWQISPSPLNATASPILMDLHSIGWVRELIETVLETRHVQYSIVRDLDFLEYASVQDLAQEEEKDSSDDHDDESESEDEDGHEHGKEAEEDEGDEDDELNDHDSDHDHVRRLESDSDSEDGESPYLDNPENPRSLIVEPVFKNFEDDATIVGVVITVIPWIHHLTGLLEGDEAKGMVIDLENSCDSTVHSFAIHEDGTEYIGTEVTHKAIYQEKVERGLYLWTGEEGESSDDRRRSLQVESESEDEEHNEDESEDNDYAGQCIFSTAVYMTDEYVEAWQRSEPLYYTIVVVSIFLFTGLAFLIYDIFVSIRQKKVLNAAKKTNEIVSSMFPKNVRDQLLERNTPSTKQRFNAFIKDGANVNEDNYNNKTKPIADYFHESSIIFADMVGFTSWSSARDASQVFRLLETVYGSFDTIAERRGVFKVETVGDCYVAACGVPNPNQKHALIMARFARDINRKMNELVQQLEKDLGPGTAALCLRIGIHSGPCTAGVLRGANARFQLFGDSVNTAARIESTGLPNMIHCSSEFAEQLMKFGKGDWLELREDKVQAKGKGELQTYFVKQSFGPGSGASSITDLSSVGDDTEFHGLSGRTLRLVDWSTETLARLLQRVVISRGKVKTSPQQQMVKDLERQYLRPNIDFLKEVKTEITVPDLAVNAPDMEDIDVSAMDKVLMDQLRQYVTALAEMYHDNPFHNWEHACNVAHSCVRFLSRLPTTGDENDHDPSLDYLHLDDPLTQFSFVLAALMHDVDHTGAPNSQLIKEDSPLAIIYEKSQAEQNSLSISWQVLMEDRFVVLRKAIYTTRDELSRFRQLLINCVMATDIMDKELTKARSDRWARVFGDSPSSILDPNMVAKSKTNILIEHLIQASDVAHTMQHWHIYRKWNECLFMEMHKAYMEGRAEKDPAEFWYQGEIGFLDFYVIPLATKLFKCGVLRVSNDEMVSYARQNRTEWEIKGKDIVKQMKEKALRRYADLPPMEINATTDVETSVRHTLEMPLPESASPVKSRRARSPSPTRTEVSV